MQFYTYINPQTQQSEYVEKELWYWEVQYTDGTSLKQFNPDGSFHRFTEIDQSRLHLFHLRSDVYPQVYTMIFDADTMKLIHFYRNTILEAGTENERRIRAYCFGYEKNIGGQTVKFLSMIMGGEVIITDDTERVIIQ